MPDRMMTVADLLYILKYLAIFFTGAFGGFLYGFSKGHRLAQRQFGKTQSTRGTS